MMANLARRTLDQLFEALSRRLAARVAPLLDEARERQARHVEELVSQARIAFELRDDDRAAELRRLTLDVAELGQRVAPARTEPGAPVGDAEAGTPNEAADAAALPFRHKHVVFFDGVLDRRSGGASGRLAALRAGLDTDASPGSNRVSVWIERNRRRDADEESVPDEDALGRILARLDHPEALILDRDRYERVMRGGTASIDAQGPSDALCVLNALAANARTDVLVMLTIEAVDDGRPEAPEHWRGRNVSPELLGRLEDAARAIESLALERADVWIFASEDARRRCLRRHPRHADWSAGKDVRVLDADGRPASPILAARRYVALVSEILAARGRET